MSKEKQPESLHVPEGHEGKLSQSGGITISNVIRVQNQGQAESKTEENKEQNK